MNGTGIIRKQRLSAVTAVAIFVLIVVRAAVQSITIDEADTYLGWVATSDPRQWWAAANNHVLNSLLMRLFVTVFGPSELTLRIPALMGAAAYLLACYHICMCLTDRVAMRAIIFLCLTANPFILDHLVAARGYSLALGFLMAAVAVAVDSGWREGSIDQRRIRRTCALSSLLLALSFASNFSFAIVNALTLTAIVIWMSGRAANAVPDCSSRQRRIGALVLWSVVPGLIVFLFFSASVLLKWPEGQFVIGAKSVSQMWSGILGGSMYRVNTHIVNPLIYPVIDGLKVLFVPVIGTLFAVHAVSLGLGFRRLKEASRRRLEFGVLLSGVILLTFLVHWIAFRAYGVLLPEKRTGLYFASLIVLVIAISASVRVPSRLSRIVGGTLAVTLGVLAGYFLCCLRLTYFQEWFWNADSSQVYRVAARYARELGTRDIESHWKWVASLNYYRIASGEDAFDEVLAHPAYSEDKKLYVLEFAAAQDFIRHHHLEVVYYGELSDVAVAVRPKLKQSATADSVIAIVRNLSRPGAMDFYAGERFEVIVNGPAGEPVYLSAQHGARPESEERLGETDECGRFSLVGQMGDGHAGQWHETWRVGRLNASPVRFAVKPRRNSHSTTKR